MFILSILSEGSEPWEGNLGLLFVSTCICDMLAKCLWNSDALSTACICILAFDFIEVGPLLLFHFVNDSIIRHHLLEGTDLFYIWKVSFCLYFKLFFVCEQCQNLISKATIFALMVVTFFYNLIIGSYCVDAFLRQRNRTHY